MFGLASVTRSLHKKKALYTHRLGFRMTLVNILVKVHLSRELEVKYMLISC